MPRLLTPKLLLRGFEIFAVASLAGFGVTLLYGNDLPAFAAYQARAPREIPVVILSPRG